MASTPNRPQVPPDMRAYNKQVIAECRANGGKALSGPLAGREPMLLTTTGNKTGEQRTVVVGYRMDGERFLVIASDNGNDRAPDWYRNLHAHPVATVELGPEKFQVRSRDAVAGERPRLAGLIDYFAPQQALTSREIPIVVLERV